MSPPPVIRSILPEDIAAITTIYRHYVLTHTATFEIEAPDEAEMQTRMHRVVDGGFPYLVAQIDGRVAGYCYAGPYRARIAYRHTIEDSVYIAPGMIGRGIGHALLSELLKLCTERGYREVVAIIGDSANHPSIRLHHKSGFVPVGTLRNVGYKFDRWLDTVVMQKSLVAGER